MDLHGWDLTPREAMALQEQLSGRAIRRALFAYGARRADLIGVKRWHRAGAYGFRCIAKPPSRSTAGGASHTTQSRRVRDDR
jgi:hypothetical protein